ncbi:MAG: precorrin-3B synthase [Salinarimonas sp.]
MSTPPAVEGFSRKGWCPGAWRPMRSGDGLILRLRPPGGALAIADLRRIIEGATRYGNGIVEVTRRAALQIRGIADNDRAAALRADLQAHGLVDDDAQAEAARQVVHDPFADCEFGLALEHALVDAAREDTALAALPAKFGFLIDLGNTRHLAATPGDIRIERTCDGGLCLRAAGCDAACAVTQADAVMHALSLARAFARHPAVIAGRFHRMKALMESGEAGGLYQDAGLGRLVKTTPAPHADAPRPGLHQDGVLAALPFGQIEVGALSRLADAMAKRALPAIRLTPWRAFYLPGADSACLKMLARNAFITDPDDPLARVDACPGAPSCASGMIETRTLARDLAALLPGEYLAAGLHVSGCGKGCARSAPAAITVIGTAQGHDLVHEGRVGDKPVARALTRAAVIAHYTAAATRP